MNNIENLSNELKIIIESKSTDYSEFIKKIENSELLRNQSTNNIKIILQEYEESSDYKSIFKNVPAWKVYPLLGSLILGFLAEKFILLLLIIGCLLLLYAVIDLVVSIVSKRNNKQKNLRYLEQYIHNKELLESN